MSLLWQQGNWLVCLNKNFAHVSVDFSSIPLGHGNKMWWESWLCQLGSKSPSQGWVGGRSMPQRVDAYLVLACWVLSGKISWDKKAYRLSLLCHGITLAAPLQAHLSPTSVPLPCVSAEILSTQKKTMRERCSQC